MKINLKLIKSGLDSIREDYTAIVVTNGKFTQEDIIDAVNKSEPHISKVSAEQVLATELAFVGARLAEGKYVNMGGFGLKPYVPSSLLHADEEVSSDMLGIQVNVYDSAFTAAVESLEVTTSVDEATLPFIYKSTEDETTNTLGCVSLGGGAKFIGERLSTGLEGEKIVITDPKGTEAEVENVTSDHAGMWLSGKCPNDLELGKGKVTIYSRGLKTPEGAITKISRSVTIIESGLPRIVSLTGKIGGEGKMKSLFDELTVTTKNVPASAEARLALYSPSGELMTDTAFGDTAHVTYTMNEDGVITFKLKTNDTAHPDGAWTDYDNITKFELKVGDTILAFPIKFVK